MSAVEPLFEPVLDPQDACPPYDERLSELPYREFLRQSQQARGLDKLRFVRDASTRKFLYELYFLALRNEKNPAALEAAREAERQERERRLLRLVTRALQGRLGRTNNEREAAKQCAERLMPLNPRTGKRQQDPMCMEQFAKALRAIRSDYSFEPDGGFDGMGATEPSF